MSMHLLVVFVLVHLLLSSGTGLEGGDLRLDLGLALLVSETMGLVF